MLLPLEPVMDVAPDPVVDVPVEPTTGALGAIAALLGAVLPMAAPDELAPPSGVTFGTAIGADGRTPMRLAAALPGECPLLARHCRINLLLFCSLT